MTRQRLFIRPRQLLVAFVSAFSVDPSIRSGHTFLLSKILCSMRGCLCFKQKFRIPLQQEDEQDPYWFVVKLGLLLELWLGALRVIVWVRRHVGQVCRGAIHDSTTTRRSSRATTGVALDTEPADFCHQRPQINASNHGLRALSPYEKFEVQLGQIVTPFRSKLWLRFTSQHENRVFSHFFFNLFISCFVSNWSKLALDKNCRLDYCLNM